MAERLTGFNLNDFREQARRLSDDEWHALTRQQMAWAIGGWLEARGKLNHQIRALSFPDLEAMGEAALARFIVLASLRRAECETLPDDQATLLGV